MGVLTVMFTWRFEPRHSIMVGGGLHLDYPDFCPWHFMVPLQSLNSPAFKKGAHCRRWRNSWIVSVGREFVLYVANLGLIPGTP